MSERRIRNNRLKRQRECRRNRTLCVLAACLSLLFVFSTDSFWQVQANTVDRQPANIIPVSGFRKMILFIPLLKHIYG